jgi:hypothetical protein
MENESQGCKYLSWVTNSKKTVQVWTKAGSTERQISVVREFVIYFSQWVSYM